jgi:hypothetical protein
MLPKLHTLPFSKYEVGRGQYLFGIMGIAAGG